MPSGLDEESNTASYISSLTATTPIGITPFVVALAIVIISGVTPNSCDANAEQEREAEDPRRHRLASAGAAATAWATAARATAAAWGTACGIDGRIA